MIRRASDPADVAVDKLKATIRDIVDFPKPGIVFKDLTPVMRDGALLRETAQQLAAPFIGQGITAVAGMEARGFIFGSLVACELKAGFIPLRKPGKLPHTTHSVSYDLEYGSAALEMHIDALAAADRVLLVDDLIATGGTAAASCELIRKTGATLVACAFVVELDFLAGRQALPGQRIHSLVHY